MGVVIRGRDDGVTYTYYRMHARMNHTLQHEAHLVDGEDDGLPVGRQVRKDLHHLVRREGVQAYGRHRWGGSG